MDSVKKTALPNTIFLSIEGLSSTQSRGRRILPLFLPAYLLELRHWSFPALELGFTPLAALVLKPLDLNWHHTASFPGSPVCRPKTVELLSHNCVSQFLRVNLYTYIHTYIYIYTYMCVCVCVYIYIYICHLRASSMAYGGFQARGQIGSIATSLHHSHSNANPSHVFDLHYSSRQCWIL